MFMRHGELFIQMCRVVAALGVDLVRLLGSSFRSRRALAAENLFLRGSRLAGKDSGPVVDVNPHKFPPMEL